MAFLSGFVKSGLSLFGKDSSFPYSIGERVEWHDDRSIWALHRGVRREDGEQVSIFIFDRNRYGNKIQLARNAFKRFRTMRHPDVLRFIDGIENEQTIMFVTDPVEPLSSQLRQNTDQPGQKHHDNLILWGLYKIANAIQFINTECNMVHGNVRVSSVFTNKAGEWKLGGFELLSPMNDVSPMILTFGDLVPDAQKYAPPEVVESGWTVIKDLSITAVDSYNLGCLIYEAYHSRLYSPEELVKKADKIPSSMRAIYKGLLLPAAKDRASAGDFIEKGMARTGYFSKEFINMNLFLENISIKEQSEKESFFRKLDTSIDTFPTELAKYKVLPELISAYEFGAGGPRALSTILKIGDGLSKEEYENTIISLVTRKFASPDRSIRVSLLENMDKFTNHIPNEKAAQEIFKHMATGFTDVVPLIREKTIMAALYLVPRLNSGIVNYDLLKYLAKLQQDDEPGIRANTTICLGKIAKHLNEKTRSKVLVPAFTRSLRDGFHHARTAALMALLATADYYDAEKCATQILPSISPVLIDPEKPVRDQAFKVLTCFVSRLEEYAQGMADTALPATAAGTPPNIMAKTGQQTAGMAGALAGWAVSSIQARVFSPSGDIATPPVQTPQSESSFNAEAFASTPKATTPTRNSWSDEGSANPEEEERLNTARQESDDEWDSFNSSKVESSRRESSTASAYPARVSAFGGMKLAKSAKPKAMTKRSVTKEADRLSTTVAGTATTPAAPTAPTAPTAPITPATPATPATPTTPAIPTTSTTPTTTETASPLEPRAELKSNFSSPQEIERQREARQQRMAAQQAKKKKQLAARNKK